ncbi:hypothetical protein Glove_441g96 [Diversispora epigaea]|uniref:Uncharacterized protein n=1 Tax=Diversispora epigaea TaxID=1348612 RepID=A0A397GUZ8_9GLOM|nr:hypothetical protein Glove_441g96 [Diversispora epigaea]
MKNWQRQLKLHVATAIKRHESPSNITERAVSGIAKQVSGKKIQISLRQLLKIVKPVIQQDIINSIANPDIARKQCKVKKKSVLNYPSSTSELSSDEEDVINLKWSCLFRRLPPHAIIDYNIVLYRRSMVVWAVS